MEGVWAVFVNDVDKRATWLCWVIRIGPGVATCVSSDVPVAVERVQLKADSEEATAEVNVLLTCQFEEAESVRQTVNNFSELDFVAKDHVV